jgi:hypothetical protein
MEMVGRDSGSVTTIGPRARTSNAEAPEMLRVWSHNVQRGCPPPIGPKWRALSGR